MAIDNIKDPALSRATLHPPVIRAPEAIAYVLKMLEQYLCDMYDPKRAIVVAIGGRLAAGKSTLRRWLVGEITQHFSSHMIEIGSVVIPVRLDDMVRPWEERIHNQTFPDKVDEAMVKAVEEDLVDGRIVQKYMLAYNDMSWRLMVSNDEVEALISLDAKVIQERGRTLLYSDSLTKCYQARAIISLVSKIFVDITTSRERYHTIERFDPRGHLVVLEGASVALSLKAAKLYAALLYVSSDEVTLEENIVLRASKRYRQHYLTLDEILEQSIHDVECQRHVDHLALENCTMIIDNSRSLSRTNDVLELMNKKTLFLERCYRTGAVPESLYRLLAKHIGDYVDEEGKKIIATMRITQSDEENEKHVDMVLNRILLHEVLDSDAGLALTLAERKCLVDNIDGYLGVSRSDQPFQRGKLMTLKEGKD
ncbi:hypothetical protein ACFL47_02705 [Candidatus Latescibacterota bacterium]